MAAPDLMTGQRRQQQSQRRGRRCLLVQKAHQRAIHAAQPPRVFPLVQHIEYGLRRGQRAGRQHRTHAVSFGSAPAAIR